MNCEFIDDLVTLMTREGITTQEASQYFYLLSEVVKANYNYRDQVVRSKAVNQTLILAKDYTGQEHFSHAFCTFAESMLMPLGHEVKVYSPKMVVHYMVLIYGQMIE